MSLWDFWIFVAVNEYNEGIEWICAVKLEAVGQFLVEQQLEEINVIIVRKIIVRLSVSYR